MTRRRPFSSYLVRLEDVMHVRTMDGEGFTDRLYGGPVPDHMRYVPDPLGLALRHLLSVGPLVW
jgi:hypothetical protein